MLSLALLRPLCNVKPLSSWGAKPPGEMPALWAGARWQGQPVPRNRLLCFFRPLRSDPTAQYMSRLQVGLFSLGHREGVLLFPCETDHQEN